MGIFSNKTEDKKNKKAEEVKTVSNSSVGSDDKEEKSMKDLYGDDGKVKSEKNKKVRGMAYKVLVKPMITEKATNLNAVNQYVFMVSIDANKIEVAKAIFEVYGVNPISVNIIKNKGKKVNRGKISGKRKDFKKAIVTLKKGESISVYEGV
ncbi:MAG: 50S ribosomal protein L23 [Patescibacteria group bacterium]|nr:50S ribosomal protein L23 [Patescibacteria group bacterium]